MNLTVSLVQLLKNLERLTGSIMPLRKIKENTRRMNRLEELGRVDAEKAKTKMGKRNLRDEKKRIVRELKADGGKVTPKIRKRKAGPKAGRPAAPSPRQQRRMGDRSKPKGGIRVIEVGKYTPKIEKITVDKKNGGKVGGLKKVQPHQKGLKKLPTKVRNKMGYMKKGGRVGMGKAMRGGGCVR